MILNTPFSGQRAESNQNVPYLIPLSLSVIRFSQHSWWTEWIQASGQSIPHTQSAVEFWCCFKMRELSPLSLQIANALLYCVCIALPPTVWSVLFPPDDLWHVARPVLALQSQPGHKLSVCWCGARIWLVTCQQVQQRDVHGAISKLMNVFTHTCTRLKVFASIVVHLLSVWAESLKTVINHYWLS